MKTEKFLLKSFIFIDNLSQQYHFREASIGSVDNNFQKFSIPKYIFKQRILVNFKRFEDLVY